MGEADFNQVMPLRRLLVGAAVVSAREENLSPALIPPMFKDIDEPFKLAHKVVDVLDGPYRKNYAILLRYNVDKPEGSYAQVPFFTGNKEDENFQRVVFVNYTLEEFIYLLDVVNFVYDNVIANKPLCNVL